MAETATRCLKCGRFAGKKANFCPSCGNDLGAEARLTAEVESAFDEDTRDLMDRIDLIDATEVVAVVRTPDDSITVDIGDMDPDIALGLMLKGLIVSILGDLEIIGDENLEGEDDEG